MKVLVTGHLGFVGTHLCRALRERGDEVVGIDLKEGNDIVNCDLPNVDKVYHLAAQTNAQSLDAFTDALVNIAGSIRIFQRYGKHVVFASTSMVNYPYSPYAISKKTCEDYARFFGVGIVRFCNLYGEGGHCVIDKFRASERITVYGEGDQLRTYAPVEEAIDALLRCQWGGHVDVLPGKDYTVLEIASWFSGKPVDWLEPRELDIRDAVQKL